MVKAQKSRKNDEHNLNKSTKSGRHGAPLLKCSQWSMKPCGGWNKTALDRQHYREVPSGARKRCTRKISQVS